MTVARKSILISYFFGDDMIPLGVSCAHAFRDFGYDVHCFNSQVESRWEPVVMKPVNRLARGLGLRREIGRGLPISKVNFKRRMLKEAAAEFHPRWVFVIRAHEFVDAGLVASLKRDHGVEKVFAWRVDGPLDSPDLLEDARIYDAYFCSHRHGYDPRTDGIRFLPIYGMDFSIFRNLYPEGPRPFEHEMVLVGGPSARRVELVRALEDLPLEIYGHWEKRTRFTPALRRRVKAKGAWGTQLLELYNPHFTHALSESLEEHRVLLACFQAGDPLRTASELAAHWERSRERIRRKFADFVDGQHAAEQPDAPLTGSRT